MIKTLPSSKGETIDDDIVAFFDLLARFDYEDKCRLAPSVSSSEVPAPEGLTPDANQVQLE